MTIWLLFFFVTFIAAYYRSRTADLSRHKAILLANNAALRDAIIAREHRIRELANQLSAQLAVIGSKDDQLTETQSLLVKVQPLIMPAQLVLGMCPERSLAAGFFNAEDRALFLFFLESELGSNIFATRPPRTTSPFPSSEPVPDMPSADADQLGELAKMMLSTSKDTSSDDASTRPSNGGG